MSQERSVNYFALLNLDFVAFLEYDQKTQEQVIKDAYRSLKTNKIKVCIKEPDREESTIIDFAAIKKAYKILLNPKYRQAYLAGLKHHFSSEENYYQVLQISAQAANVPAAAQAAYYASEHPISRDISGFFLYAVKFVYKQYFPSQRENALAILGDVDLQSIYHCALHINDKIIVCQQLPDQEAYSLVPALTS